MNETMSLLLATAILAAGGISLFMFKSPDDKEDYEDTEDVILDDLEDLDYDDYEEDYKPRHKSANKNKTKRNRKSGGSRRRY
jgi:hypothetical protein